VVRTKSDFAYSPVSNVTGYYGWALFLGGAGISLCHHVQLALVSTHPNPMGTGGSYPAVKQPEHEADHSTSYSVKAS